MTSYLIDRAIRWRVILFAVGIVLLVAAYPVSRRLRTEQKVTSLFSDRDPSLQGYLEFKKWFGRNDALVLMYRDDDLASDEGIERSRELTERVQEVDGVNATISPWVLNQAAKGMNPVASFTLGFGQASEDPPLPMLMRKDDPVGSGLSDVFSGYTHSDDYAYAAVVALIKQADVDEAVPKIRAIADQWETSAGVSEVALVGEPVLVEQAFTLVKRDGSRLAWMTLGLLSLVVVFTLFDFRLVILMGLVIGWSVTVTRATMFLLGIPLSLIASILTAIVTVVAVTAVLHLGVRYQSRRGRGFSQTDSTRDTFRSLVAPIFWTCATDAAGFAALCFSEIRPVRQFGLMIALSAACVFFAIVLFAPLLLVVREIGSYQLVTPVSRSITRTLRRRCSQIASAFIRFRTATVVVTVVVMLASTALVFNGETETNFLRNFRDSSTIVIDYGNVEDHLGGAGVWDLMLDVPASVSNDFLAEVLEMEAEMLREYGGDGGLRKAISVADATEVFGKSTAGKLLPASLRVAAMKSRLPNFIRALISEPDPDAQGRRKLRVMLRSVEDLPAEKKQALIDGVAEIAERYVTRWNEASGDSGKEPIVTGYYVIMTKLVAQLIADQWRCFLASAVMIWMLMFLATRSMGLALAALLPNLLPAFLVIGAVSSSGGRINMGAAMIAAVSVGLSIDGSVHLLTSYRRRRERGRAVVRSAVSAAGNVGAPVLLATVALVVGFSVLATSEFIPTATFGTLVAWTLVIGTLINLSVLPALIGRSGGSERSAGSLSERSDR